MESPNELSLREIRDFMLKNNCKVTNHALVKHFKRFLTNPDTQNEARKQFKTYVNILATIKNENNEKFLILRKKYLNECPPEDIVDHNQSQTAPTSPGGHSIFSEGEPSPYRQPPPYKPPPEVSPVAIKLPVLQSETVESYRDCVSEFQAAVAKIDPSRAQISSDSSSTNSVQSGSTAEAAPPSVPPRKRASVERSFSREGSIDQDECNKENVAQSDSHVPKDDSNNGKNCENDNKISVKEATKKFNRMASEEEAKVVSPTQKKKPEKAIQEDKMSAEVTLAHPKAKEWIVAAAKSSYQDLAKLASENPELVKLHDPTYTALHWAAKHGNEDVVKLIAGTYKADVNARTNGGYTPLHLSMQFGRDNIFELLCNVYRANRDITDWSGKKALDYRQQRTTVSASTYSKIKARRKQSEKDLGFLRIGSLNVRVKKTTEAFSNFLGVGGGNTNSNSTNHHQHPHHPHHHSQTGMMMTTSNRLPAHLRSSAPPMNNYFEKIHKSWGSADNIPHNQAHMPPPKNISMKKKRSKRSAGYDSTGFSSMPTTPNQVRAPIGVLAEKPKDEHQLDSDSDSAFGFDSSWSKNREKKPNVLSGNGGGVDGSGNDKINPTYI